MTDSNAKSMFLTEISQQPQALRSLVEYYSGKGMETVQRWAAWAKQTGRVMFSGMGTSEFAAEMVLQTLGNHGVDASTVDAGELLHYPRPINGLLVLLSQSGESIETRKLAEHTSDSEKLIAITNNGQSTLGRVSKLTLLMKAGEESAITNKTYVNTLAVLYLMSRALAGNECIGKALDRLYQLSETINDCDNPAIERAASLICDIGSVHFVARGPVITAAKQAALTFMEGARCSCTALTGGAFRHGPFELVGPSHRVVFFIPGGATCNLLQSMAKEVAGKGSHVVVITDQNITLSETNCCVLKVADYGEELFALSCATTQELLLDVVARKRGIAAGIFRYGQKVTAKE